MNLISDVFKRSVRYLWCAFYNMDGFGSSLKFDNKALRSLPLDKVLAKSARTVPGACFSLVEPTPVDNAVLVAASEEALALLGVKGDSEKLAEYFSGNRLFDGSQPAAHCYCGHQFGYFSGQLGDGAAMYLGEIINSKSERWELQLKGAGLTPYSRTADGRKVLRSSIREFLCSEAMFHLGIPTTRAGTCVTSDSRVMRDIHYDGHPIMERCTIVSRIAQTFIRFGSFEIFKPEDHMTGRAGPSVGRTDILKTLLEYVIETFYPEIANKHDVLDEHAYMAFYEEVVRRTAHLVAKWQSVGFCHGVLNTDNMSIVGITIDYGPFGFLDYFDADFICNASDNDGRYTYKKQPEICKWNLLKLAEALKDVMSLDEAKKKLNEIYDSEFSLEYYSLMRKKMGLLTKDDGDEQLVQRLLSTMQDTGCDFTNTFQVLSQLSLAKDNISEVSVMLGSECQDVDGWNKRQRTNVDIGKVKMFIQMGRMNPGILSQLGVSMEDLESMLAQNEDQKNSMTQDEKTQRDENEWKEWLQRYRERLFLDLHKENTSHEQYEAEHVAIMASTNPRYILRNHMAKQAIDAAEEGDYTEVQDLLRLLKNPFALTTEDSTVTEYAHSAPPWAFDLKVT